MTLKRFRTIGGRAKIRAALIAAMFSLVAGLGIGTAAVVQTVRADGSDRQEVSSSTPDRRLFLSSSQSSASSVPVPDIVGLGEGEAVKALGASGLVANVRYDDDGPRTGKVLRSVPEAGRELAANSVVVLSIALRPRLPVPGQEHEGEIIPLSSLVEDNPNAFVGLYRDEAGVPHVVFGPGVDPETWEDRLTAAAKGLTYPAEGIGYRTDTCSRNRASLRAVQDETTTTNWTENKRLSFAVWVHPETCTVRFESDLLTRADTQALVDRFGTAISIDSTEGSHPVLAPLGE